MKQIKIRKDLWDLILKGEKKYEFRKLEKGYTTGTYEFVSIENVRTSIGGAWIDKPKEVYGTATLKPRLINPNVLDYCVACDISSCEEIEDDENHTEKSPSIEYGLDWYTIDDETYNFVKENYVDKGIDFVFYEISDAKGSE